MKITVILSVIASCAALLLFSACSKQQATPDTQVATTNASEGIAAQASKLADQAQTKAQQVTDQAATQASATQQQAQSLIDKAKAFIADKKYQDALSSLNQLTGSSLTADQQKLVADLKDQIQKALASNPASALGGALKQ